VSANLISLKIIGLMKKINKNYEKFAFWPNLALQRQLPSGYVIEIIYKLTL